jgi:hypothetical protein
MRLEFLRYRIAVESVQDFKLDKQVKGLIRGLLGRKEMFAKAFEGLRKMFEKDQEIGLERQKEKNK